MYRQAHHINGFVRSVLAQTASFVNWCLDRLALTYASDQQFFDSDHMNREAVWLPAQPLWLFPPQLWGKVGMGVSWYQASPPSLPSPVAGGRGLSVWRAASKIFR